MVDRLIILRRSRGWLRGWLLLRRVGRSYGPSCSGTSVEALLDVCVVNPALC